MRDEFLSVSQLAEWLGVSKATIYNWRYLGQGPRAVLVGSAVRYRVSDVEEWLEAQADPQPAA
jgi:excisionase family DNA binding protein